MSKIGKKVTFYSEDAIKTSNLYSFLTRLNKQNITISEINEKYDENLNIYAGSIVLSGEAEEISNLFKSERFSTLLDAGTPKYDSVFSCQNHYEELKEIPLLNANFENGLDAVNLYKFKAKLEYNFLVKNYEDFVNISSNSSLSETALPNFYDVLKQLSISNNYNGFNGTTFYDNPSQIIKSNFDSNQVTFFMPSNPFYQNQTLPINKYMDLLDPYKEQFPFYTDISFDTHQKDENNLSDSLHKKDLLTPLLKEGAIADPTNLYYKINNNELISGYTSRQINVDKFLTEILNNYAENDFTFIFDINSKIDQKSRTFKEILEGKEEYSEIIGYHLRKTDQFGSSNIQNWYIPNIAEQKYKIIDTQIKYDKIYAYKLDLIVLTFSTEYTFEKPIFEKNNIIINFVNRPVISVHVLNNNDNLNRSFGPIYKNKLLDFPPLEPEVEIIPYIGINNKIKISLNTSTGLKEAKPIFFSESEEQRMKEIKSSQDRLEDDPFITFQSDEPSRNFEIYRLEYKPTSYSDYLSKRLTFLSSNNSSAASYVDIIEQNKKYYYVARSLDYHQNFSNPTPIYEVEIVNDNGTIYPLINIVDFDKKENLKQSNKQFKKYIKIQPALQHKIINNEKALQNQIELGVQTPNVWNKKFKIRLTSKSTGKKIDINLLFKYNIPT